MKPCILAESIKNNLCALGVSIELQNVAIIIVRALAGSFNLEHRLKTKARTIIMAKFYNSIVKSWWKFANTINSSIKSSVLTRG